MTEQRPGAPDPEPDEPSPWARPEGHTGPWGTDDSWQAPAPWQAPEPWHQPAEPAADPVPPAAPDQAAGAPLQAWPEQPRVERQHAFASMDDQSTVTSGPAADSTAPVTSAAAGTAPGPGKSPRSVAVVWVGIAVAIFLCCGVLPNAMAVWQGKAPSFGLPGSEPTPIPTGTPTPVPSLTGSPFVSAEPQQPPAKLRNVKPVSVVGPTWEDGEKTYTFAFRGVPFAFRGGEHWGCMSGTWETAAGKKIEGLGWRCIDEQKGADATTVDMLVRRCTDSCSASEQKKLDTDWLDAPVEYVRRDPTTRYAEGSDDGAYTLVVSHYFAGKPGGTLGWQVGLSVTCQPVHKATCQKVVNDIRTQSG